MSRRLSYAICFWSDDSRSGTDGDIRQLILGISCDTAKPHKKNPTPPVNSGQFAGGCKYLTFFPRFSIHPTTGSSLRSGPRVVPSGMINHSPFWWILPLQLTPPCIPFMPTMNEKQMVSSPFGGESAMGIRVYDPTLDERGSPKMNAPKDMVMLGGHRWID